LSSTLSCILLCYHSVYLTICLSYLFFIPNNNILQYESTIWATADLLRGSGIKESE